jgi:hypothetical protein
MFASNRWIVMRHEGTRGQGEPSDRPRACPEPRRGVCGGGGGGEARPSSWPRASSSRVSPHLPRGGSAVLPRGLVPALPVRSADFPEKGAIPSRKSRFRVVPSTGRLFSSHSAGLRDSHSHDSGAMEGPRPTWGTAPFGPTPPPSRRIRAPFDRFALPRHAPTPLPALRPVPRSPCNVCHFPSSPPSASP